jgi:GDPmannose 4,6-dehydratase
VKTALITGVVGQDGAYLARHLRSIGYRVVGTGLPGMLTSGFVSSYLPGVELRVLDIRDRTRMRELISDTRPDEIYNLASISSVAASWETPIEVAEVNGLAFLGLLEVVRTLRSSDGYSPRICQASSSEMMGTPAMLPQDESHPLRPLNPYATAKSFAHFTALSYRSGYDMFVSNLILFNHESPLRPSNYVTRTITSGAVAIAAGQMDQLNLGRLDIRRDWGHAADYVGAMHLALQADGPDDYVIATGESRSLEDFAFAAFRAAGVASPELHIRSDPGRYRPTDIAETRGDPSKAGSLLGWRPTATFDELVASMVAADSLRIASGLPDSPEYMFPLTPTGSLTSQP